MFKLLFERPLAALLTIAGVSVLAPVLFPLVAFIIKPVVKPLTNLYLDLTDEVADAFLEREQRKGVISPEADLTELKRLAEAVAEDKGKLALDARAAGRLVEEI